CGNNFPALLRLEKTHINNTDLICATINDLTKKAKIEKNIQWRSTHDPLTHLSNRQLLQTKLQNAINKKTQFHTHIALIFIDLDNVKLVNDTYGHEMGDKLLKIIADILSHSAHPQDRVARFGGDEFVILCEEIKNQEEVIEIIDTILDVLHQPMALESIEYVATAIIGIAFDDTGSKNAQELLKDADAAIYRAKDLGRDQWIFFKDLTWSTKFSHLS
ncbi:MAG: GGDEF domain-containing protein, partial [Thalassotalea sp.]|nr:GGDEF domain-containing protein [Thalassotalea sp.]